MHIRARTEDAYALVDAVEVLLEGKERLEVELDLHIPEVTDQQKLILQRTTKACPVARSLHPDTKKEVVFNWR